MRLFILVDSSLPMRFMTIKLDMSKVYNRVKWIFFKAIMSTMRFQSKWIQLMMHCVTVVSYSILINGDPQASFKSTRGIWQGDPFSP